MPEIEQYDAVVLGSGEAGKYMAWHLGSSGKRVAVIERKYIGGACPNIACLPSKNLVHGAKVASYFQRGEEFGMLTDKWTVSMPGVRARKRQMVEGLLQMHLRQLPPQQGGDRHGGRPLHCRQNSESLTARGRGARSPWRAGLHQHRDPGEDR